MLLGAKVWHYWVAFPLAAGGAAVIVGLLVGYIRKVIAPRYRGQ